MNTTAPIVVRNYNSVHRLWHWSHANGLTLLWISVFNIIGWIVTVVTCH